MTLIMLIFCRHTKVQLLGNIDKATLKFDLYWRRIHFTSKIYQSYWILWSTSPILKIMLTKILIWVSLRVLWCYNRFCDFIYYLIYESEYQKMKVSWNPCTYLMHWSFSARDINHKCFYCTTINQSLPPMSEGSPILKESAVSLAAKIRNQEPGYSSVNIVKAYIERIQHVNDIVNAVVDTR